MFVIVSLNMLVYSHSKHFPTLKLMYSRSNEGTSIHSIYVQSFWPIHQIIVATNSLLIYS